MPESTASSQRYSPSLVGFARIVQTVLPPCLEIYFHLHGLSTNKSHFCSVFLCTIISSLRKADMLTPSHLVTSSNSCCVSWCLGHRLHRPGVGAWVGGRARSTSP